MRNSLRTTARIVLGLFAMTAAMTTSAADSTASGLVPTLENILESYRAALSASDRIALDAQYDVQIRGTIDAQAPVRESHRVVHRRDGDRYDVCMDSTFYDRSGTTLYTRRIWTVVQNGRELTFQGKSPEDISGFVAAGRITDRSIDQAHVMNGPGQELDGYVEGDGLRLPDVLASANEIHLAPAPVEINGHLTYAIEADTKYGHYALWIDPAAGFNPRRIELRQRGDSIRYGEPISKPPQPNLNSEFEVFPHEAIDEYVTVIDVSLIERIDDVFVPTAATRRVETNYRDGRSAVFDTAYKRSAVDLHPDFASLQAFKLNLPDGVFVIDNMAAGVQFEWRNGGITPVVGRDVVGRIDEAVTQIKSVPKNNAAVLSNTVPNSPGDPHYQPEATAIMSSKAYLVEIVVGVLFLIAVVYVARNVLHGRKKLHNGYGQ